MQLKKLEMCGFKSFVAKTEIAFEPGVTCIVGPNGCGKSNVVDAIKWVLGTLSHKSIRGEEMMDVIFKGAEGIGPAGMAEVSLTLDNSDHSLPLEYEEVTITRRLHRSGEGEYLINKNACRLKDIRDLLYGTGIGTDNYSIIEQGKIDRLVTSDPRSRRLVFDEAAGISKYRARKKETENRLEKVTGDLLRLNDVIREVQRELRSVRGQAGRASRYKELQTEYRGKRLGILDHDYRELGKQGGDLQARIGSLEAEKVSRDEALAAQRAGLSALEKESRGISDRHSALTSELSAAASRAEFFERTLSATSQRLAELSESRARADQDRQAAAANLADKQSRLDAAEQECAQLETELAALDAKVAEISRAVEEAVGECRRISDALEAKKNEAIDKAQRKARYGNDLTQVKADQESLVARSTRNQELERKVGAEQDELNVKVEAAAVQRTAIEAVFEDLKRSLALGEVEQARLKEQVGGLDGELLRLRATKDRSESRRETLRELEMGLEGLGQGARQLLRSGLPGLCGTVADLFETSPGDVAAVEAVLGENAGTVVFETREQARAALDFVRTNNLPRTAVLSLDHCLPSGRTGMNRASFLVRTEDRFRPVADAFLGSALIVRDAESAELFRTVSRSMTLVTRSGETHDPLGLMSTGSRVGGLLSRKTELKTLETEIGEFLGLIARMETDKTVATDRLTVLDKTQRETRHAAYDQGMALNEASKALEQHQARLKWLVEEREHLSAEQRQIAGEKVSLEERGARLEALLAELAGFEQTIEAEIKDLADTARRFEEGREQLRQALQDAQVGRAAAAEKRQSAASRAGMIRSEMSQHQETVRRQEEAIAQVDARLASVTAELEKQKAEQLAAEGEIEAKRTAVENALRARDESQGRLDAGRTAIGELQGASDVAANEMQNLRVQEAQHASALQNIATRAREEFEIDLATAEPLPAPSAGSGQAPETPVDWEALAQESEELRMKIAGFGAVNVVALEQLGELETRDKDLQTQQDDIEKAKRQLEELIRRIDRESKVLFERTLEYVREQFGTIFRKVFGGGKADIVLQQEPGVDPLDQGLEVMARIPQRELMPISSLSGGQKTLTAFSLVMALFRANPSPFCILDEADAALDEANVDKYASMVNEFVSETQFIVISHNKRTMAAADVLYGVTMETPGVSKKVSVDLSGTDGMDSLRKRRDELLKARTEATTRKAAEMAQVKAAAEAALELEVSGGTATAVAEAEPEPPKPEEPEILDASKLLNPYNYSSPGGETPQP